MHVCLSIIFSLSVTISWSVYVKWNNLQLFMEVCPDSIPESSACLLLFLRATAATFSLCMRPATTTKYLVRMIHNKKTWYLLDSLFIPLGWLVGAALLSCLVLSFIL